LAQSYRFLVCLLKWLDQERVQKVKDYIKRPLDVIRAIRSLNSSGSLVSLPFVTASGEMFFKIEGSELTVAQMLRLLEENQLNSMGIRQFCANRAKVAGAG
jgi:hypothetical protein